MPKIIHNVREQLLTEAKKQVLENGYGKTTIRSVANACGLGVGTVYNYFKSKDILVASFMAEDWNRCLDNMRGVSLVGAKNVLLGVYNALIDFASMYQVLFSDSDAAKVFATVFAERHKQLRDQLAVIIMPICEKSEAGDKEFLAEYIAESLLTWTIA